MFAGVMRHYLIYATFARQADDRGSDVATNPFSPASSLHHGSDAMTDLNGALKGCAATSCGVETEARTLLINSSPRRLLFLFPSWTPLLVPFLPL